MSMFTRQISKRSVTVFGFETILISGAVMLAAQLHGAPGPVAPAFWKVMLVTALCELCFYYNDLYDLTRVHARDEMMVHVLRGTGAAAIASAVLTLLLPSLLLGTGVFITTLAMLLIMIPLWRLAFIGLTSDPHLEHRILIVGTGRLAQTVARQIRTQHEFAYRVVGFIEDPAAGETGAAAPVLGTPADLARLIAHHRVDRVVVGLPDRRGHLPIQELLHAKLAGVRVEDAATIYERIAGKILVDELKPSSLIFADGFEASRVTRFVKRTFDIVCALVGGVLALPIMALTALAVRLDSAGPILYRQERVGENGRPFTLCKFRSMRTDAEQGTPLWARDHDDRVTRVGRFIRMARLDELPQFWNVL